MDFLIPPCLLLYLTALSIFFRINVRFFVANCIFLCYNHFRTKKRVMDPTPLEVEIREYERTVNQSILDQNERIKSKQKRRGERV